MPGEAAFPPIRIAAVPLDDREPPVTPTGAGSGRRQRPAEMAFAVSTANVLVTILSRHGAPGSTVAGVWRPGASPASR